MKNETRREFLVQAGTLSASFCCLGATTFLASCGTSKNVYATVPSLTETAEAVTFPAAAFAGKNYLIVPVKKYQQPLYISKQADGTFLALRMHCTHRGCEVNATPDKFICPCHGSQFSLHGDVLKGPAKEPLASLPVNADSENVIVHFS